MVDLLYLIVKIFDTIMLIIRIMAIVTQMSDVAHGSLVFVILEAVCYDSICYKSMFNNCIQSWPILQVYNSIFVILVVVHFACLFYNFMCYTCISCLFREPLLSVYFQALMRPGRLDRILYVPLPDLPTRRQIFTIHLNRMPTGSTVDVDKLVTATGKYSGAEVIFAQ